MQSKSLESSNVIVRENGRFLRNVLRWNALFSTLSGLFVLFFAETVAQLIGLANPMILVVLGIGLLPFAFFVYQVSAMKTLNYKLVWTIIVMDVMWVVGSVILLFSNLLPLTTVGKWSIGLLADVVAIFAILEYVGVRKAQKESGNQSQ